MQEDVKNVPVSASPVVDTSPSVTPKSRKPFVFIGVIVVVLIVVGIAGMLFGAQKNSQNSLSQNKNANGNESSLSKSAVKAVSGAIVYGFWSDKQSIISAIDLQTNTNEPLAVLPLNIKHVKVLSPQTITYIKNTDVYDRGTQIVLYDIPSKKETVLLQADTGFGIDDYVVSANSKYMSAWEVRNGAGGTLSDGTSRVYSVAVQTQEKHLLYDEIPTATVPVHYPVAVTDTGTVFTDRFLPNSGAGWGYGMSKVDFNGLDSTDIASMTNGTYSTQPVVSPNGTKLVFAGYDGKNGAGSEEIDGYRRALVFPNTISTLDLSTLQRNTLLSAQGSDLYASVSWNPADGKSIIYSLVSKKAHISGAYLLRGSTNSAQMFSFSDKISSTTSSSVAVLSGVFGSSTLLVSQQIISDSSLGNLGSTYAGSLSGMYLSSKNLDNKKDLDMQSPLSQFISLQPASYMAAIRQGRIAEAGLNSIQVSSFYIKPSLAPEREREQSAPPPTPTPTVGTDEPVSPTPKPYYPIQKCQNIARVQCNQQCGKEYDIEEYVTGKAATDSCFATCVDRFFQSAGGMQSCFDSPLYLYGRSGTKVQVQVDTAISTPNVSYTPKEGFDISLLSGGTFTANGKTVSSLSFDYQSPVKKLARPTYGNIVAKAQVEETLRGYAVKFGLNTKETSDILLYAKEHLGSSYTLISFYDDELSKQILPLIFNPVPDHYRNIVFYFEEYDSKPQFSVAPPVFEKVRHDGFSAVEISYILK